MPRRAPTRLAAGSSYLVGAKIRHGRRQSGLTQEQLACLLGISQETLSKYENDGVPGMSYARVR